jgi:hypothetical protein
MSSLIRVNDKGLFTLANPFVALTGVEYQVTRLITIPTLLAQGVDVLQDVFITNGLTIDTYNDAVDNDILIVTLTSATGTSITLPANYITGMPNVNTVPYTRRIVSVDLGSLPSSQPLDGVKLLLKETVLATVGVDAVVNEYSASTTGSVSMDQHLELERVRVNKRAVGDTERQRRIAAEEKAQAYKERMLALEAIVVQQQARLNEQDA